MITNQNLVTDMSTLTPYIYTSTLRLHAVRGWRTFCVRRGPHEKSSNLSILKFLMRNNDVITE